MTALGIVLFVAALLVSVMLHEGGHFLTARHYGMKATQFFVGFGPTLFSRQRGETEYGVKAIPAGGFVKIVGMTQLEEVDEADQPRAFWRQKPGQRLVVLSAGSFTHFVIGLVLVVPALALVGQLDVTNTVRNVSVCLPEANGTPVNTCPADRRSPAAVAGLQAGDQVVAVGGTATRDFAGVSAAIRAAGAGSTTVTVMRDGAKKVLDVDLTTLSRTVGGKTVAAPFLGIAPTQVKRGLGAGELVSLSASTYGQFITGTFKGLAAIPAGIPKLIDSTFNGAPRDATGLAGPAGIGKVTGDLLATNESVASKVGGFLLIVASVNVFVGIFNLLPLLPLDGGHVAIVLFEGARSKLARLFGRPDPGRVDLVKLMPIAYGVVILFIGLSVLLLAADIVNPIANPFG